MSLWIEWNLPEEMLSTEEINEREQLEELFRKAVEAALAFEKVTTPVEIGLQIVSEEEIRTLNRDYREIDRVTDVLSFPMLEYEEGELPCERVERAMQEGEADPETEEVPLGDIIICQKRAKEQAAEYGHSFEREMAFLSVHSVLHLLGYDHMVPEEEKVMFSKQEEILNGIGLTRE